MYPKPDLVPHLEVSLESQGHFYEQPAPGLVALSNPSLCQELALPLATTQRP